MDANAHAHGHSYAQRRQTVACSRQNRLTRHNRQAPAEASSLLEPEPHPVTSNT